jgi:hypothetical protein
MKELKLFKTRIIDEPKVLKEKGEIVLIRKRPISKGEKALICGSERIGTGTLSRVRSISAELLRDNDVLGLAFCLDLTGTTMYDGKLLSLWRAHELNVHGRSPKGIVHIYTLTYDSHKQTL